MLKKTVNLVALMMLVSTNVLSPFSYAGEIGAVSEETIDANLQTENFYETQSGNTQDSSVKSQNDEKDSQNDGIVVPLGEIGDGEAEGIFRNEEEKILSPSDSSFQKGAQEEVTQNSQQFTQLDGVEGAPLDAKNNEGEIENDEQKDSDLEDMPKILADEISPIDMLTLELGKSEQPQVQDVSTVIDYYPDSNVRYTLNGNENFTAGTITITDGTDTITILDRNLGATATGTGCHYKTNGKTYCSYDDTYGYHFQWGNNHGFKPGCDLSGSTNSCSDSTTLNAVSGQVDATTISYNPANQEYYNSGVFYKGSGNWLNDNYKVNLWGGSTGDLTTFVELTEEQAKLRQGPCPKGFHVPSVGEFVKLSSMMTGSSDSEKDVQLHNLLYIPYAGFRDHGDAYVYDMGYYTYLWSSSPSSSNNNISWNYNILDPSLINYYISRGSRADAYSIRCFYDKYETYEVPAYTLSFIDDGVEIVSGSVIDGETREGVEPTPATKTGYRFDYRYAEGEPDTEFDFDTPITTNTTLYAHWTFTADIPDGIYTGVDENGNGVKTVIFGGNDTFSGVHITIKMTDEEGTYYRGNNIAGDDTTYNGVENNDRWGGSGDIYENGINPNPINLEERQGPCDSGYHVPSIGEWNALVIEWCNLDEICNATYYDALENPTGNLRTWKDKNYISGLMLGIRFKNEFNMSDDRFWSSSPSLDNALYSWFLELMSANFVITSSYYRDRDNGYHVRCLKNFVVVPEVDTTPPSKPEMGVPTTGEIYNCILDDQYCPQYDFDKNGRVTTADLNMFQSGVLLSDNTFIKENEDITNSKNPRFIRSTPGGAEGVEEIGGYEMQICSDSGCNNVIHSGSYEEVVGHTDLEDGTYYWRVRAIDKAGNEGERSDILSFTVDTEVPSKPEMGVPTTGDVLNCIGDISKACSQYDFNNDGEVSISDYRMLLIGVPLSDNTYINENNDITNSKNPRFIRSTPGGAEGVEEIGGYEMQICSDSGCNNVIHSGSYEEVVGHTDLDDGKYYWRVKTIDKAGNEGERSDILSFTVDTIAPVKPEIGCPDAEEVLRSINMRIYCPQYDFDLNGRLNANDATLLMKGICTSGDSDTFIKADGAVTSNKTPRFVRSTPGGTGGAKEISGYEIQICSDSSCNNVAYSGSYEEIVQNELLAGKYYWRVKAIDRAGNEGEWSDILSFTVTGDEEKKSGGSSGGGGRSSKTSDIHPISSQNDNSVSSGAIAKDLRGDTQDSSNKSLEGQEILSSSDSHNSAGQVSFTNDQKEAYGFARSNGITTTSSIEKAKMNTTLTRIQMAKMLSNFAINVMKQEPDVSKGIIKFNDVTNKMNKQYDYAVTKAYQLGIMGQNVKSNNFRPNDEVTRAEFATALSRLLYNTSDGEYKSTSRYYILHIKKLMQKGIITKDDPKMKEKRGYVMIMLMRSVK